MCFLLKLTQAASIIFLKFHPSCYQFLHTRKTLYSLVVSQRQETHLTSFANDKWIIEGVKVIVGNILARCSEGRAWRFPVCFTIAWTMVSWSLSGEIYEPTFAFFSGPMKFKDHTVLSNENSTRNTMCLGWENVFLDSVWLHLGQVGLHFFSFVSLFLLLFFFFKLPSILIETTQIVDKFVQIWVLLNNEEMFKN